MRRISFKSTLCSLFAAAAVVAASVVVADSQVTTLSGESLYSENFNSSGTPGYTLDISTTCDATKLNGTVNYALFGSAAGPYAGTYNEQGYFRLANGVVTELSANFTIIPSNGGANVTGTKTLGGPAGSFKGLCSSTGGGSTQRTAVVSGVFNYTASVNGAPLSGAGGMSLDVTETSTNSVGTGFAHINFYASATETERPKATGGGSILHTSADPGITFGFNAQLQNDGSLHGRGVVYDHSANIRIKILSLTSLVVAGTHATIYGQCEVNGNQENCTIDVDDIDEPGILNDKFAIKTDTYGPQAGLLTGGNIQVRGAGGGIGTPTPTPIPE